jgi:tRNA1Val (adenine37-N6)-methyltransferase
MSEETLDALFRGRLKFFQRRDGYRFSLDALLLAHFVSLKKNESVADLGTGNGIIPLLLATLHSGVSITGVEFQPAMAERAERNVKLNELAGRIRICRGDVRAIRAVAPSESFDVVVCNPPYRRPTSGRISPNDEKRIARHELQGDLGDFLAAATFLLRRKGRTALIYPAVRFADLICAMRHARVEPKRLRAVHSFADAEASLVLVEGVKGGRPGAAVEKPLRIYRGVNEYTDEVSAMIAGTRLRFGQSRTAEPPG